MTQYLNYSDIFSAAQFTLPITDDFKSETGKHLESFTYLPNGQSEVVLSDGSGDTASWRITVKEGQWVVNHKKDYGLVTWEDDWMGRWAFSLNKGPDYNNPADDPMNFPVSCGVQPLPWGTYNRWENFETGSDPEDPWAWRTQIGEDAKERRDALEVLGITESDLKYIEVKNRPRPTG